MSPSASRPLHIYVAITGTVTLVPQSLFPNLVATHARPRGAHHATVVIFLAIDRHPSYSPSNSLLRLIFNKTLTSSPISPSSKHVGVKVGGPGRQLKEMEDVFDLGMYG